MLLLCACVNTCAVCFCNMQQQHVCWHEKMLALAPVRMPAFFLLRCRLLSSWLNLSFNVALALAFFRTHICAAGNCAGTASMGVIPRPLSGKKIHIHAQICIGMHLHQSSCLCSCKWFHRGCLCPCVCVCLCARWWVRRPFLNIMGGEDHLWILNTRTHRFNMLFEYKFRFSVRGQGIYRTSTD